MSDAPKDFQSQQVPNAALIGCTDGLGHTAKLVELVESCCMDFEKLGLKPVAELYREELRKITCSLN